VQRFAHEGVDLYLGGGPADADDLAATLNDLRTAGAVVEGMVADVADEESVARMVDAALAHLGGLDIVVSNAGVYWPETFLEITPDHWQRMLAVNLTGMFLVGQRVARHMAQEGLGDVIINTASTNGLLGDENAAHYNAAKAGVIALTKSMALDLAPHHIRVNCVCPGMILTRMTGGMSDAPDLIDTIARRIPLDRFGTSDEVAGLYAFLASEDASYMTGACLIDDGGLLAGLRWRGWITP
jgi:3-oxoacyl-[acyl-carrier protein] reductase